MDTKNQTLKKTNRTHIVFTIPDKIFKSLQNQDNLTHASLYLLGHLFYYDLIKNAPDQAIQILNHIKITTPKLMELLKSALYHHSRTKNEQKRTNKNTNPFATLAENLTNTTQKHTPPLKTDITHSQKK